MRISDWSSDVCSSDLILHVVEGLVAAREDGSVGPMLADRWTVSPDGRTYRFHLREGVRFHNGAPLTAAAVVWSLNRSEEHTSELQSLMRISYAVFCLNKTKIDTATSE